ncbi:MAG: sigma-54 interaction domain-containing protein [Pirellulaceae bacterium]
MPRDRVLTSWIGHNDMRAMAVSLPAKRRDQILEALRGPVPGEGELGPIRSLTQYEQFNEIRLLSNYPPAWEKQFAHWLGERVAVVHVDLKNPTDYAEVFRIADRELAELKAKKTWANTDLSIHLSPGTPTMTAIWLLLGKTRYPATFYQTYEGRAWVTDVPFNLVVDFVPEVFRQADAHLQHLTAQSPGEIEGFQQIVGDSKAIRLAVGRAQRAAVRNVPVLILGESGTGKELFARAIHQSSSRRTGPFLAINCAAVSRELLESELFGHAKGAFTGADRDRKGAFEEAHGGTLFLDEVGECDPQMQAKLLRVLQPPSENDPCYRTFSRVGESGERHSSVRVIAATNRDLLAAVNEARFREDLYYRLAVITIKIPPLRDRQADIPALTTHLLGRINEQFEQEEPGYCHKSVSESAMVFVQRHPWPGNVRQLYNVLLQAAVMSASQVIQQDEVADAIGEMPIGSPPVGNVLDKPLGEGFNLQELLNDLHRHYLRRAMREAAGVKSQASRLLGIPNYQTLDAQLKRLGIDEDWR